MGQKISHVNVEVVFESRHGRIVRIQQVQDKDGMNISIHGRENFP